MSGGNASLFAINSSTGAITTAQALALPECELFFQVTATDTSYPAAALRAFAAQWITIQVCVLSPS